MAKHAIQRDVMVLATSGAAGAKLAHSNSDRHGPGNSSRGRGIAATCCVALGCAHRRRQGELRFTGFSTRLDVELRGDRRPARETTRIGQQGQSEVEFGQRASGERVRPCARVAVEPERLVGGALTLSCRCRRFLKVRAFKTTSRLLDSPDAYGVRAERGGRPVRRGCDCQITE